MRRLPRQEDDESADAGIGRILWRCRTAFSPWSGAGKLLRPDVGRAQIRAMRARSMSGPLFFAVTTPVAAFAPYGAQGLWVFAFPLARISFVWFFGREGEEPG
jgi:hypothetical protein